MLASRAFSLAAQAHEGQRSGALPYWAHLREVWANVVRLGFDDERYAVVAYLHDILEDTPFPAEEIEREFGADVRLAVEQLTRRPGQSPSAYFDGMGELALAVKLADRYANHLWLGQARPAEFDKHRALLEKYEGEMPELRRRADRSRDPRIVSAAEKVSQELLAGARRIAAFGCGSQLDGSLESLPKFFIVGRRPVKAVPTPSGGMDILAFDWGTGGFVRGGEYLTRISFPDGEVDQVDEEEFERRVEELQRR